SRLIESPFGNEFSEARAFDAASGSPAIARTSATTVGTEQRLTMLVDGHDSVVITDPQGRSTYLDPDTGEYVSSVPDILALRGWTDDDDLEGLPDDGPKLDVFEFPAPVEGDYRI